MNVSRLTRQRVLDCNVESPEFVDVATEIIEPNAPLAMKVPGKGPLRPLEGSAGTAPDVDALEGNRVWDVLPAATGEDGMRQSMARAAELFSGAPLQFAGVRIDAAVLVALAQTPSDEPVLRAARELLRMPVRLPDFLYFLDDVIATRQAGGASEVVVSGDGARRAGLLVHPEEIFAGKPRSWGHATSLRIIPPKVPFNTAPVAQDHDPLGPGWAKRYRGPRTEAEHLEGLTAINPRLGLALTSLLQQLRAQGADVWITSTTRSRERGYLMWGAFLLSRATSASSLGEALAKIKAANEGWGLNVPITWEAGDWEATRRQALEMCAAYDVVFATEKGARFSNHYGGRAFDIVAQGLPQQLTLTAPWPDPMGPPDAEPATFTFDLSDAAQTRDLNLTPELIEWIERHFDITKLEADYPHWDAR